MENYSGIDVLEIMDEAKNYNRHLADLLVKHSPSRKVLDFGAGTGAFAKALRARGFSVTCIEPDVRLRRGLTHDGFTAYSTLAECREEFEFIYSINVLEHIADDKKAVLNLSRSLSAGGKVFLYVPAFMLLYSPFDKKIGHLRRYTARGLKSLVGPLHADLCHYVDCLGFFAALAFRIFGPRDGAVSPRAVRVFDRFVFPLSRVLDRLLKPFFGKNVLLVAHKR